MASVPKRTAAGGDDVLEGEVRDCVRRGDRDGAITRLMRAHGAPIYRYCRNFIGHDADAYDVMQTVFVQASEGLRDPDMASANLRGWLYGIARHRCLDDLRRRRRRGEELLAEDDGTAATGLPAVDAPEPTPIASEVRSLTDCLDQLDGRVRAALLSRYHDELSYDEMAVESGERAGTLRVRVARALPQLRRCLERKGIRL